MALRAWHDGAVVSVVSWFAMADSYEIVTLNSDRRQSGVRPALMDAAVDAIRKAGARRLVLSPRITTTSMRCVFISGGAGASSRFTRVRSR